MRDMSTRDVLDRTEMINPQTFEDLKRLRMEYVQASRRNGTDIGMKRLLTDLYPGRAHFIYELIQNADDAGATEVEFELKTNRLSFSHNGKRLFDLDDIKSITNVGQSTKKADGTTIGKFGVGFKSVYSYTSHPVINSGKFHFQIYEMMIPEEIDETYPFYSSSKKTVFILPFDLKDKPAYKSFREIQEVLENFSEETILFLRNINVIKFEISGKQYKISKKEIEHLVSIDFISKGKSKSIFYLKFSDVAKIKTSDGAKSLPVDIAYRLIQKEEKNLLERINILKKLSDKYQIVPVDADKSVYVSFIADKEYSGLSFCINSFFSTTPSRDSVRDTDDNRLLIGALVKLQEESLRYIRDNGFLNIEFLRVLPNSKDNLSDFYRPFYDNIIRLFREEPYMISKANSYIPSRRLLSGVPSAVTDLFSIDDLVKFSGNNSYRNIEGWARNSSQKNSRADVFIEDLQIKKWGIEEFIRFISYVDDSKKSRIVDVLKNKTSQQLISLYCLIDETKNHLYPYCIRRAPIFKLIDGSFASIEDRVYLLESSKESKDSKPAHNYILPELYLGAGKKREQVLQFLKKLDIGYYSSDDLCREIVEKYQKDKTIDSVEHINDIETLIRFNKFSALILERNKMLQAKFGGYSYPNKLFLDSPYSKSPELAALSSVLEITPLSSIYKERLLTSSLKVFIDVVKDTNIITGLQVESVSATDNPLYLDQLFSYGKRTSSGTDRDYTIKGLTSILSSPYLTKIASKLIWEFLLNVSEDYLQAAYSPNGSSAIKNCYSQFVQLLINNKWFLHSDGSLYLPEETSIDDLPDTWSKPKNIDPYSIQSLKAIGFGKKLERIRRETLEDENACKRIGVPKPIAEIVRSLVASGCSIEQITSTLNGCHPKNSPMPVDNSLNPARRNEVIKKEFENAETQATAIKERTVRVTVDKKRAKAYLKSMYTDDRNYLRCQMCRDMMPFKKKDGEFYFEATQITQNMKKEFPAQYLCLCPNCAAEYSEWVIKEDGSKNFIQAILHQEVAIAGGNIYVSIRLSNGKILHFCFTQKHFIDIKAGLLVDYRTIGN